jgi:hypothetical protein
VTEIIFDDVDVPVTGVFFVYIVMILAARFLGISEHF